MTFRFFSTTLTPSLNPRGSQNWRAVWGRRKKLQKTWAQEIMCARSAADIPHGLKCARVTITRYSIGTLDEDNLTGGVKALVDVLKPPGQKNPHGMNLILDDTPERCALVVRQVRVRKRAEQKVEVVVEPWFPQEAVT